MFDNFTCGVVFGLIAAFSIGFVLNEISGAKGKWGQQHRTLNTYSDAEQPSLTAAKIVKGSWLGALSCIFWLFVLIAVIYGLWLVGSAIREFSI